MAVPRAAFLYFSMVFVTISTAQEPGGSRSFVISPQFDSFIPRESVPVSERVDFNGGVSVLHDSFRNLEGSPAESGLLTVVDFGAGYSGGVPSGPGVSYSVNYGGRLFLEDESSSPSGNFDQNLGGDVKIRGGLTTVSIFGGFSQNSGNTVTRDLRLEEIDRSSVSFRFGVSASRKMTRGTLNGGVASQSEVFDEDADGLAPSDRIRWAADAGYFYDPPFLARTDFGVGATIGEESVNTSEDQTFFSPSFRTRWKMSDLTNFSAHIGVEQRSITSSEGEEFSATNQVWGMNLDWKARVRTTITLSATRRVTPSIRIADSNQENTLIRLGVRQSIGEMWSASVNYGFERSDYTNFRIGEDEELEGQNLHQFGATLGRNLYFDFLNMTGSASVFYNFRQREQRLAAFEFPDQHIYGVRLGFSF
ncbi:MAG: hypothetical protein AAGA58_05835 [Verrucomicrobiota bacterium]